MSLYPLAMSYGGCIDNSLAYASTPRLHCFRNDSVIGFLLAASVFSYPDGLAFTPALYKGCQSLYRGNQITLAFCVLSIAHHDGRACLFWIRL